MNPLLALLFAFTCVSAFISTKVLLRVNAQKSNVESSDSPKTSSTKRSLFGLFRGEESGKSLPEFVKAALDKNINLINSLSAATKEVVNAREETTGKNAMHYIAKKGHYQYPPEGIPTLLIDKGIDINAKDGDGRTSLEISLLSGWQKIAILLLDKGADKSVVTSEVKNRITCPDCKRVVKTYSL
jgi:ankyrin repeat protein